MRESYWGYWIIILGVFVIFVMMLISNVTTTNTQDYYLIKEVTEQSMVDAVDLGYYRTSGELRINADRFVESFLRRFAENVAMNTYTVDFYGIYEAPPKVSVKVTTKSATYNIGTSAESFDIVDKIDAILELDGKVSGSNEEADTSIFEENGGTSDKGIGGGSSSSITGGGSSSSSGGSSSSSSSSSGGSSERDIFNEATLRTIIRRNKDDFYDPYTTQEERDGESVYVTTYRIKSRDRFLEVALNYFYYENNDEDLDKFEQAQVEDLVDTIYDSLEKSYERIES